MENAPLQINTYEQDGSANCLTIFGTKTTDNHKNKKTLKCTVEDNQTKRVSHPSLALERPGYSL